MNDRHLWEEPDCPQTVRLDPSVNISIDPFPEFGSLTTALAPLISPVPLEGGGGRGGDLRRCPRLHAIGHIAGGTVRSQEVGGHAAPDHVASMRSHVRVVHVGHLIRPSAHIHLQRTHSCPLLLCSIEHGNYLNAPTASLMAERGAFLVPTLVTYEVWRGIVGVDPSPPARSPCYDSCDTTLLAALHIASTYPPLLRLPNHTSPRFFVMCCSCLDAGVQGGGGGDARGSGGQGRGLRFTGVNGMCVWTNA